MIWGTTGACIGGSSLMIGSPRVTWCTAPRGTRSSAAPRSCCRAPLPGRPFDLFSRLHQHAVAVCEAHDQIDRKGVRQLVMWCGWRPGVCARRYLIAFWMNDAVNHAAEYVDLADIYICWSIDAKARSFLWYKLKGQWSVLRLCLASFLG